MSQPSARDWVKIENDLRKVLNNINKQLGLYPYKYVKVDNYQIPSKEELDKINKRWPGANAGDRLEQMAISEMHHRIALEKYKERHRIYRAKFQEYARWILLGFALICLIIIVLSKI